MPSEKPPEDLKRIMAALDDLILNETWLSVESTNDGAPGSVIEGYLKLLFSGRVPPFSPEEMLRAGKNNNNNAPDWPGVELKCNHWDSDCLLTLKHMSARWLCRVCNQPKHKKTNHRFESQNVDFIRAHGLLDDEGRWSLRHTFGAKNGVPRFRVVCDGGTLMLEPLNGGFPAVWGLSKIENGAVIKLETTVFVNIEIDGEKPHRKIRCLEYMVCEDIIRGVDLSRAIEAGVVRMEINAREWSPGSIRVRDHGPRLRIDRDRLPLVWDSITFYRPVERNGQRVMTRARCVVSNLDRIAWRFDRVWVDDPI